MSYQPSERIEPVDPDAAMESVVICAWAATVGEEVETRLWSPVVKRATARVSWTGDAFRRWLHTLS